MQFDALSDRELLNDVISSCKSGNELVARIVAQLAEVERRRMHLELGYSSMLPFCEGYLGMSKGEACRRLVAARLVQRYSVIVTMLEQGEIRLEGLSLINRYLTDDNAADLLARAARKTTAEIEELIAKLFPQADAANRLERAVKPRLVMTSEDRHKLTLMLTDAQKEKLLKARDLMSHLGADFVAVVDAALDELLRKLEKKTTRTVKARPAQDPTYVPRAVRREVLENAEQGCEYVSDEGKRCGSRERLQVDHRHPKARGGKGDASNTRLLCAAHNLHEARRVFGATHVDKKIEASKRELSPAQEQVQFGLVKMGFTATQVRKVLSTLNEAHSELDVVALFKLALSHLSQRPSSLQTASRTVSL